MLKAERAAYIDKRLETLYPETPVPLAHRDSFTLLVAVLLSAQCTDERVNQVTPALFELADNPQAMARKRASSVERIIKPCGLAPKKSRAIIALSKILVRDYNGAVPQQIEELEKLPGVGHKTASVVVSQAFGQPAFPVDTHIHRLAQRWGLTSGKNVLQTERDLKKLFPEERWNKLHLQFIFYGREYCTARGCDGTVCEICCTCYPKRKNPVQTQKA
ncbi:MAG: endonuclease III [Gammaproteobacteria bacterium]|nr:endonuclease III [Gammaproteobacteria bacterium]NND40151.1 endonuclease III [Pseudomonadales bacterium]MBT8150725.1 endonuclease III [Gammaproteobacteria bacterium]NNL11305.1 endonuclease III [Pseudomonadales bacterium]NNM12173.1 endonuclease III [Pseudomonadales bacterium]